MKRIIFILAVLLAVAFLALQAQSVVFISGTSSAAPTYMLNEGMEAASGAGPDSNGLDQSGWTTIAGTTDVNFAGTNAPLVGSESLYADGNIGTQYIACPSMWEDTNDTWVYFRMVASDLPDSDTTILRYHTAGTTQLGRVQIRVAGTLRLYCNTVSSITVGAMSAGTEYQVWVHHYYDGTAAISAADYCSIAFTNTSGTKPTSGDDYYTENTSADVAGGMDTVRIGGESAGNNQMVFDRILADDVEIGDNP